MSSSKKSLVSPPKKEVLSLTKAEMTSLVNKDLNDLRASAQKFTELVDLIQKCSNADVSFGAVETCKSVCDQLSVSKSALDKIRKTMILRAKTRMRELS